jgi:hypothetical protein
MENQEIFTEIESLKKRVEKLEKAREVELGFDVDITAVMDADSIAPRDIFGFHIKADSFLKKDQRVIKIYHAYKTLNKRCYRVYLGKELTIEKIRDKIKNHLEKRGFSFQDEAWNSGVKIAEKLFLKRADPSK